MSPEEEAACPVCGKLVDLDVSTCPHCGAEFEEEEVEAFAVEEDETAACPVCGKMVSLSVSACNNCGAEFEEEEVEEIVEVEERLVPQKVDKPAKPAKAKKAVAAKSGAVFDIPTSLMDFRIIGIALILLGIAGAQVAAMIDWYWSWVPAIEDNLALFVMLPVVVLIVGLLIFMLVNKAASGGKKVPDGIPGVSLAVFLFGIIALIVMLMWNSINSALESSPAGVAGGFLVVMVVGVLLVFMGMRSTSEKSSPS
ncbi:MAG: zinc ribbon domain-containing protein [Thermoplasmata archaeon]|nr:zinc ribbon domain-containing protein [Thermoplasmata archaeon]